MVPMESQCLKVTLHACTKSNPQRKRASGVEAVAVGVLIFLTYL
jgi:hypothetical protein